MEDVNQLQRLKDEDLPGLYFMVNIQVVVICSFYIAYLPIFISHFLVFSFIFKFFVNMTIPFIHFDI